MLRGLATVSFFADDLAAAQRWYSDLLGVEPYFARPGYVEFRVGDYQHELGIIDRAYAPAGTGTPGGSGAIVYWAVDDVPNALDRLLSHGATGHQDPRDVGGGFVIASVLDPFGNVLGVMRNPHYLQVLTAGRQA